MMYYLENGEDFDIPLECAYECSRPGRNDEAVAAWVNKIREDAWPSREGMLKEIRSSGGWVDEDISAWDELKLRRTFLWIIAHLSNG